MKQETYRPIRIEFNVAHDGSNMPESFGQFKSADEALKFIGASLISVNQGVTVARHMDVFEKTELRKNYSDMMENIIPLYEQQLSDAEYKLTEAKNNLKHAQEAYDTYISEVKTKAQQVKRGLVDFQLDELFTFRVAYKGRYYYYTYIDQEIKLCLIRDIPEYEKSEIWNQMAGNEEFIDKKLKKTKK